MEQLDSLTLALMVEQELAGEADFASQAQLELMVEELTAKLAERDNPVLKLALILQHFYQNWSFSGDWEEFYRFENTQVSKVLERRKGIPITLGILLLYFFRKAGLNAQGICFPSQFLICVEIAGDTLYIDPFDGQRLERNDMELKLRGVLGNHARLKPEHLNSADHKVILKRLLGMMKASLIREEKVSDALVCSDILLRLEPDDPYEVRDRGFLLQQLDCFGVASDDFEYFIKKCPDDPVVELLKIQLKEMAQNFTVMH